MSNQTVLFNEVLDSSKAESINSQELFSDALGKTFAIHDPKLHVKAVKDLLARKMARIRNGNKRSGSGIATVRYISEMVDSLIRIIWDSLEINSEPNHKIIALVAVGGYGRLELCPKSDIDLLILTSERLYPEESQMAETIIRSLWDYGFEVGSSVRSIKQCEEAMQSDLQTWTSFLDERFLGGNYKLYRKFLNLMNKSPMPWKISEFIKHKLQERSQRIQKFGGLIQLLEPNLKSGTGCLREIHTIMWTARFKYGCKNFDDLAREGLMSPLDLEEMRAGYEFLMRARCSLHFITQKKDDFLAFYIQPDVASEFGLVDLDRGSAVEYFLQSFF